MVTSTSAHTMKPTHTDLPQEVYDEILDQLHVEDVRSLRLTCQFLHDKTADAFKKLLKVLVVDVHEGGRKRGFQRALQIAGHDEFRHLVQELKIQYGPCKYWYGDSEDGTTTGEDDSMATHSDDDDFGSGTDDMSIDEADDEENVTSGSFAKNFGECLRRFDHLETLDVTVNMEEMDVELAGKPWEEDPEWAVTWETYDPEPDDMNLRWQPLVRTIFTMIYTNDIHLRDLKIGANLYSSGIVDTPLHCLYLYGGSYQVFDKLRTLALDGITSWEARDKYCLHSLIRNAPDLENLDLSGYALPPSGVALASISGAVGLLNTLTDITLRSLEITYDQLECFLLACPRSVRHLGLEEIVIRFRKDELGWKPIFKVMRDDVKFKLNYLVLDRLHREITHDESGGKQVLIRFDDMCKLYSKSPPMLPYGTFILDEEDCKSYHFWLTAMIDHHTEHPT